MSAEEWRPIPLAPGYEASDQGRVRSFRRGAPAGGRLLALPTDQAGYHVVRIFHDGAWRPRRVHQLVLEAFIGPRPCGAAEIRHLNDVKDDNRLSNLAYGTTAENMRDRVANGIHHYASRDACKRGHKFTPANTYIQAKRPNTRQCRQCQRDRCEVARLLAGGMLARDLIATYPHLEAVIETRELRAA